MLSHMNFTFALCAVCWAFMACVTNQVGNIDIAAFVVSGKVDPMKPGKPHWFGDFCLSNWPLKSVCNHCVIELFVCIFVL